MRTAREVLANLEQCFDQRELETLVARDEGTVGFRGGEPVKVIHKPTGREFLGEGHATQINNKISALLQLLAEELRTLS
jgi:hypothetical protein